MAEEQLTDELLERLLASASPEAYLSTMEPEDRTLSEYLFSLLHDKGLSRSDVFAAAGIDRTPRKRERPSDHAPVWAQLD